MRALRGECALVTGGSSGIGRSVAEAMVREGMDVVVTSRDAGRAQASARALSEVGPGRALGLAVDVRDFGAQRAAVERLLEEFGRLDVLIANAGVGRFGSVSDLSVEDWRLVIDTNLSGVFYSVKACVEALEARSGMIVTIGSLAGANFFAGGSAYNASKFGLAGFSQAVMLDLRQRGVRVSTIMPGSVATPFGGRPPGPEDGWKIQAEDIAEMVLYLLQTHPRTLPSKIEVRPSRPPKR